MAEQVPRVPKEPANGTGSPLHQKPAGHTASTAVVVENGLYPRPHRVGHHMTRPAPGVRSYLPHLSHCIRKRQRGLSLRERPPWMLWRLPSPCHCHGKIRCERRKISKSGTPLLEGDSQSCPSPTRMEGCSISDVLMAEEGPQRCDSDIVVKEEVEESMEMDEPSNIDAPTPLPDKALLKSSEAEA